MAIIYKSRDEIAQMRVAGRWVHTTLERCRQMCQPGVSTAEIDAQAEQVLAECGGEPLFKNYPGSSPRIPPFPAATCISVNEEIVHGIPGHRVLEDGDIVSIDFGVRIDGWCGDSATTVIVGQVPREVRRLCEVTRHVLDIAIENMKPGVKWSQVARRMENYARQAKLGIVKEFVGHGIGQALHEDPKVPNFVSRELIRNDIELEPGLVLAVEPMCCLGGDAVRIRADQWTVVTADGSPAAHYEHTLAVTDSGCEILTDGN